VNHALTIENAMLRWLVVGNGAGHIILYAGTMLKSMNSVTRTMTAKLIVHVFLKKTLIQSRNANLETLRVTKQHLAGNQFKIRQ
jgi:hypothetical protein